MKAVRSQEGGVAVVEVDEPPGVEDGELLDMRATSVCASDLSYIRFGSTNILGHELAGRTQRRDPCRRRSHLRLPRVRAMPKRGLQPVPDPRPAGARDLRRRWHGRAVPRPGRTPGHAPARDSTCATRPSSSPPRCPGTRCAWPTPGPASGWPWSGPAPSDCSPWQGHSPWAPRTSRSRRAIPISRRRASASGLASAPSGTYDVVIEAAGSEESLARCGQLAGPSATIAVLGVHYGPVQVNWMDLFHHEARLVPSLGYCAHDGVREMEEAAAMLAGAARHCPHRDHAPLRPRRGDRGLPGGGGQAQRRHPGRHRAFLNRRGLRIAAAPPVAAGSWACAPTSSSTSLGAGRTRRRLVGSQAPRGTSDTGTCDGGDSAGGDADRSEADQGELSGVGTARTPPVDLDDVGAVARARIGHLDSDDVAVRLDRVAPRPRGPRRSYRKGRSRGGRPRSTPRRSSSR